MVTLSILSRPIIFLGSEESISKVATLERKFELPQCYFQKMQQLDQKALVNQIVQIWKIPQVDWRSTSIPDVNTTAE